MGRMPIADSLIDIKIKSDLIIVFAIEAHYLLHSDIRKEQ